MNIPAVCVLLVAVLGSSSAFILDLLRPNKWNDLKVTWGINIFSKFNSMPRTVDDAEDEGFTKISSCDDSSDAKYRGNRYAQDGDMSLVLLFDKNGYIAGIQTVVPKDLPYNYPRAGLTPPFIEHEDGFYLTAYFVTPDTICSTGRTASQFRSQGTGNKLLIQNGENPDTDFMTIPLSEDDISSTNWVKGQCFKTMGNHYWYNITRDMNCDYFYPVFLLYNDDKLNGFGWGMGADLPSSRLEHPPPSSFDKFMVEPPTCLNDRGRLSTMHIYLTSRPLLNFC